MNLACYTFLKFLTFLWQVEKDIDYQTSSTDLHLRYLEHKSLTSSNIQYSVGVGTSHGADDEKAFETVDVTGVIHVTGLELELGQV